MPGSKESCSAAVIKKYIKDNNLNYSFVGNKRSETVGGILRNEITGATEAQGKNWLILEYLTGVNTLKKKRGLGVEITPEMNRAYFNKLADNAAEQIIRHTKKFMEIHNTTEPPIIKVVKNGYDFSVEVWHKGVKFPIPKGKRKEMSI